ncbi:SDR family NAD(P)-dependent oxidoreductase [Frankia sp. AgB1.9]|uniref:SDR family NAD(P)-dependent oxidoreductase n=1 Tax=unclassified Frankia TaxID=2632575 RepID=UPI0019331777|nr:MULTISPECIES: SDR family NAD(P)-dependent oxidoreductase [unclassified Frankia]MBL7489417.1 SDR family NAD(P)-dependent oxidoreductase [Frankia sp. AgW1.1]MBL7550648.1 SDR family NAD(P)-dependent oxidoreductase [Frankia sp. AgB1.9]MBL7620977.1 SDR family NAD(P)-dependent oxidoreductase [Frankia sp. AgB1.8]
MDTLEGKVAVVTGGASGIGAALGRAFVAAGCAVVLADVDRGALNAAAAAAGGQVLPVVTDVSDPDAVDRLADQAFRHFGAVHVVCNNAGVSTFNPVSNQALEDWHWVLGVNLWGVVHGVRTFLPRLLDLGQPAHIVNTSSIAGLMSGLAGLGPYAVSKVGVLALSETLRQELAMAGAPIGVSVLCPGSTATGILDSERNRPDQLGREDRTVEGEGLREIVRAVSTGPAARTADQVAAAVLEAIHQDRFWVITSGEMREPMSTRFTEILEATPTL